MDWQKGRERNTRERKSDVRCLILLLAGVKMYLSSHRRYQRNNVLNISVLHVETTVYVDGPQYHLSIHK